MLSNVIISESVVFHMPFQFAWPFATAARTLYMARGSDSVILRNGFLVLPVNPRMLSRIVIVTDWMTWPVWTLRKFSNGFSSVFWNEIGAGT